VKVLKFGGTSVGDAERIGRVASLVEQAEEFGPPLVVVSALGGVTDLLVSLGDAARRADRAAVDDALSRLRSRHEATVEALGVEGDAKARCLKEVSAELLRLGDLSVGVSLLGELSPRISDALAASGELLSSLLLVEALAARGVSCVRIDPRDLLATNAGYGAALPDEKETLKHVEARAVPELLGGRTVVTGGFVGAAPDGSTTTLGRGGSDYSAALLGAALHDARVRVEAIEIWTDVDGILTADPRRVPGARLVPEVSYAEAAELAFFGAKVLHPATIRPAVAREIPVVVRNTFHPASGGTVVRRHVPGTGVKALAAREGVAALFVGSPRMLLAHGFAARVFGVFERLRVPVDVISTSEVSISITVDAKAPIDELVAELSEFSEVSVLRGLAVVSVVGMGLRTTAGIAARIFGALRDVNIVLISQGASDTNLTFVVDEKDVTTALRSLHAELFP
jgi:aspartate kinase